MNIYYNPQDYGLEIVGDFEFAEADYSFDMCVIWKEARGKYWVGEDSGCSCPSPFEDIRDKNELDGPYNKAGLRTRLEWIVKERTERENSGYHYGFSRAQLMKDVSDILRRIS